MGPNKTQEEIESCCVRASLLPRSLEPTVVK